MDGVFDRVIGQTPANTPGVGIRPRHYNINNRVGWGFEHPGCWRVLDGPRAALYADSLPSRATPLLLRPCAISRATVTETAIRNAPNPPTPNTHATSTSSTLAHNRLLPCVACPSGPFPEPSATMRLVEIIQRPISKRLDTSKVSKIEFATNDNRNRKLTGQSVSYFSLSVCPNCGAAVFDAIPP